MLKKFVLSIFLSVFYLHAQDTFLISYPRSGSSWLMYIMQYLTQRPCSFGADPYVCPPIKENVDAALPPFYRSHGVNQNKVSTVFGKILGNCDPQEDQLVIIVRNYRECMLRNRNRNKQYILGDLLATKRVNSNYFAMLNCYDKWHPEKRHYICYEELMKHPQEEIRRLGQFLAVSSEKIDEFLTDLKSHVQNSFKLKVKATTPSGGTKLSFHSDRFKDKDFLKRMDAIVEKHHPHLWKNYLKHYKLQENN